MKIGIFFIFFLISFETFPYKFNDNDISIGVTANEKGINFGFAVDYNQLKNNNEYRNLIKKEAKIIVPENELKWSNIHPSENTYNFDKSDYIINFALKNNLKIRGHNLVWHNRLPEYILSENDPKKLEKMLREHITKVVGRYKGKIESWDVVNEIILPSDKNKYGLRNSHWYKILGEKYIDIAFDAAHKADPKAILIYNEWGVEYKSEWSHSKRKAIIDLITNLKKHNIPINGFGIQSHISTRNISMIDNSILGFIKELKKLDMKIYITELDVNNNSNLNKVDETYRKYLNLVLSSNSIDDILIWGVWNKTDPTKPKVIFDKNKKENSISQVIRDVFTNYQP